VLQLHRTALTDRNDLTVEQTHGARCRARPRRMLVHVQSGCVDIMTTIIVRMGLFVLRQSAERHSLSVISSAEHGTRHRLST